MNSQLSGNRLSLDSFLEIIVPLHSVPEEILHPPFLCFIYQLLTLGHIIMLFYLNICSIIGLVMLSHYYTELRTSCDKHKVLDKIPLAEN